MEFEYQSLTDEEKAFIKKYRTLSDEQKAKINTAASPQEAEEPDNYESAYALPKDTGGPNENRNLIINK